MRQDFYTFPATHKLILSTNCLPRVRGTDHGTWRRVRVVEFPVVFWTTADRLADTDGGNDEKYPPDQQADEGLTDRLAAEREGILADMVAHAVRFYAQDRRFDPPPEVMRHVAKYREREDVVGRWFNEFLHARAFSAHPGEKGKLLFDQFRAWYDAEVDNDEKKRPSAWKFYQALQERFDSRLLSGTRYYAVEVQRNSRQNPETRTVA